MYRGFLRLVDRLPMPTVRTQRIVTFLAILAQGGICITGAVVRVTASGLGCTTWPQCQPGSLTPTDHSNIAWLHQYVEFGNRLLTIVLIISAIASVLVVTRARRRSEIIAYAWAQPLGTVAQAVIGGITVLVGLAWWSVAVHLLASMLMVWLCTVLYVKVGEPDDADRIVTVPRPLRGLMALSAAVLAAALVAGTMVTGAGPHAGDKSADRTVSRLDIDIEALVHLHADFVIAYLALLVGLWCGLRAIGMRTAMKVRMQVLIELVVVQAGVGIFQYYTDLPAVLVVLHVGIAAAITAATAAIWARGRMREYGPAQQEQYPALI